MKQNNKWLLVALLWVTGALNYLDRQVIFSLFPPIQKEFGVSDIQLGLLSTAFLWIYGIFSPLGGYLADRYGRRRMILLSVAIWSLVTGLTGLVRGYPELLAARALMGISEACYLPAALALIADSHGDRTRSLATGLHQGGIYAGIILGGVGGGYIGALYGWRFPFLGLGIGGVLYSVILTATLKEKRAALSNDDNRLALRSILLSLMRSPVFLIIVAVNCIAAMAYWMIYTWLPLYLFEHFKMSLTGAGFSATIYIQLASFAGILAGGSFADRWSAATPRARFYVPAIGLSLAAPFLYLVGGTSSELLLIPSLICVGLGRGFFDCNLMPIVFEITQPGVRATAYGVLNFTSCVAGGAIAVAAGALKTTIGLGGAIQISAVLLAFAAFALARVRWIGKTAELGAEA